MEGVWRQTRKLSYWTSDDTRNAVCTTLASAGIGFLVLSRDRDYHMIIKTSVIRAVLPRDVVYYRVMDLLGYGSAGYATYLVYKYGGGFSYSDTAIALCLYGGVIVLDLATGFQSVS
ncbi:Protein C41G7.9 b [Aphelenchoides avenae]|nr:Protein C41G7.9 b [Aphelenchus avenae]